MDESVMYETQSQCPTSPKDANLESRSVIFMTNSIISQLPGHERLHARLRIENNKINLAPRPASSGLHATHNYTAAALNLKIQLNK
ncbi:hypothetical protein FOXB_05384 [Fusarium oxysporum f. sp. conglutinans Fo5176]|uniref:Uncharacterized protein n=1 Tax=Fusarium oxysporum (strain Fo5176) TaxID=660025 RepID=F9FG55_FUSOF|nr:hypothetical protein FOXB_05384 [Fusarium oxysporum f. sp. conglutinans Fo5176]